MTYSVCKKQSKPNLTLYYQEYPSELLTWAKKKIKPENHK